jgi:hypothetical protein
MPDEPDEKPRRKRGIPPPAVPGPEEYVVFEVDGFAQLTPEQKTWPVVSLRPRPAVPPTTAPGTPPG